MANMFFLSKNYLNADDTITPTSNDAIKTYLYDQNKSTQWESTGETDEDGDYSCQIEITFYEGSLTTNRTIDTIVLQNINLKKFKFEYYDGSWNAMAETQYTTNADTSLRIKLSSSVTCSKIRLMMDETIVATQEKKVGELWLLLETLELTLTKTTRRSRVDYLEGGNYRLADGILEQWTVALNNALATKWQASYQLQWITDTVLNSLKDIYDTHDVITVTLDYARDVDAIYLCQWTGEWRSEDNAKIQYHSVMLELKEQ